MLAGLKRGYNASRPGAVGAGGLLEDYTATIAALLELHCACGEEEWLEWAAQLQHTQDRLFWGGRRVGYYSATRAQAGAYGAAGASRERAAASFESRRASPASESVRNLQRLAVLSGDPAHARRAREAAECLVGILDVDGTGEAAAQKAPSLAAVAESMARWPASEGWPRHHGEEEAEMGARHREEAGGVGVGVEGVGEWGAGEVGELEGPGVLSPRRVAIAASDPRGFEAAALQYALFSRYNPGAVAAHLVGGERAVTPLDAVPVPSIVGSTGGDAGPASGAEGEVEHFAPVTLDSALAWEGLDFRTLPDGSGAGGDIPQAYVCELDPMGEAMGVTSTPEPGQLLEMLRPPAHAAMAQSSREDGRQ